MANKFYDSTGKEIHDKDILERTDNVVGTISVRVILSSWDKKMFIMFPDASVSKLEDFEAGYWTIKSTGDTSMAEDNKEPKTEMYNLLEQLNTEQSELRKKLYHLSQFIDNNLPTKYGEEYDEILADQKKVMQAGLGFLSERINIIEGLI